MISNKNNSYMISNKNLPIIFPKILKYFSKNNLLLNLNFPNCKQNDIKGLRTVICSNQKCSDEIIIDKKQSTFKIGKMNVINKQNVDDLNAIKNGYITLSSLLINLTNKNFTNNYEF